MSGKYLARLNKELLDLKKNPVCNCDARPDDETLMEWFRLYVKDESTTMSSVLNQHILSLKRGGVKPKNILYSNQINKS